MVDLAIVVLLVASVIGGYRRGALLQGVGLVGVIAGLVVAALVSPLFRDVVPDPFTRAAVILGLVLVGIAIGESIGWIVGLRAKRHVHAKTVARVDALGGAVLSAGALLLVIWFLGGNLLREPIPVLSRAARGSEIVRTIARELPPPPSLLGSLEQASGFLGLPQTFGGPPPPARPAGPARSADVHAAAAAAEASTVEVMSTGCSRWYLSEGSGFVVAPGYVVTNAHVVAGGDHVYVAAPDRLDATVVLFDPYEDIAVLDVPLLQAPTLRIDTVDASRGTDGAVLGYPGGGPLHVSPAAVDTTFEAVGHDIYGRGRVRRQLYELQAEVQPGNSGGPFVLPDGHVAGVVFAASTAYPHVAYALTAHEIAQAVARGERRTSPASTDACISG